MSAPTHVSAGEARYLQHVEMVNKKNKNNRKNSTHRHVFCKKKLPGRRQKKKATGIKCSNPDRVGIQEEGKVTIEGSRIINLEKLQQYTNSISEHLSSCQGSIILTGESRDGLASILTRRCSFCKHTIKLETSQKVKGPRGYIRLV